MKQIVNVLAILGLVAMSAGCVLGKKTSVTANPNGTFTTNTTVIVNEANLTIDSAALQAATAIAVNTVRIQTHNDPGVLSALRNAKVALDGVLMGASQQTTAQVLDILRANGNPALQQQVTSLVQTISALEQSLLQKYGVTVAGEITISILKSVDAGLAIGVAGP